MSGWTDLVPHVPRTHHRDVTTWRHNSTKSGVSYKIRRLHEVGMVRLPGDRVIDWQPSGHLKASRAKCTTCCEIAPRPAHPLADSNVLAFVVDDREGDVFPAACPGKPLQQGLPCEVEVSTRGVRHQRAEGLQSEPLADGRGVPPGRCWWSRGLLAADAVWVRHVGYAPEVRDAVLVSPDIPRRVVLAEALRAGRAGRLQGVHKVRVSCLQGRD